MTLPFCKFHGFGNDYIVIERENVQDRDLGELAKAICARHTGAGADGIAVVGPSDSEADFFCDIVNPDGSVAGFSGNGTRCAVAYLYEKSVWSHDRLRLETLSGTKDYTLIERPAPSSYVFQAEVGRPRFASREIPVMLEVPHDAVVDQPIAVGDELLGFSAVNVGNPVACIFVDEFTDEWRNAGRSMEGHEMFPERTNVVFVRVIDSENIEVRIWERGAGETAASGTCSLGAAVLSAYLKKTGRAVNVHSQGGTTRVRWRDDGEMVLTGRADLSYCGEWPG